MVSALPVPFVMYAITSAADRYASSEPEKLLTANASKNGGHTSTETYPPDGLLAIFCDTTPNGVVENANTQALEYE